MKARKYLPSDLLKPFIKAFMILESEQGMNNSLLPDTALVMAFRCGGETSYIQDEREENLPNAVITGIRKSIRIVRYAPETCTFLVIFQEAAPCNFFGLSANELFNISLPLEDLVPAIDVRTLEGRLTEAESDLQRINIVESFLLSKLKKQNQGLDPSIMHGIHRIHSVHGALHVGNLAKELCMSRDAFEKRFRRHTGASPKRFAQIVRLRNLISKYRAGQVLTTLGYDAGYFDQSHFIKDFKSFTGKAPLDFFRSSAYW
jgi:AraC-like DNA-binding protein